MTFLAQAVQVLSNADVKQWVGTLATPVTVAGLFGWLAKRQLDHEKDDATRFVDIDLRANDRQERVMEAVSKHANHVQLKMDDVAKDVGLLREELAQAGLMRGKPR